MTGRPAYTDADVEAAVAELVAEGAAPGSDIHSWRCAYPDMYGPCDCVAEAVRSILDAVAPAIAARAIREAAGYLFPTLTVMGINVAGSLRYYADEIEAGR